MNKTIIAIIVLALVLVGLLAIVEPRSEAPVEPSGSVSNEIDAAIRAQVIAFGQALKNVSLTASATAVSSSLAQNYAAYLTPELLAAWQNDPSQSLGRSTSSPWPDSIDVVAVSELGAGVYQVDANVIEVAQDTGGKMPVAVYPITLELVEQNGQWLIAAAERGAYSELPQRVTVTGMLECLPHKDTTGPQTLECAFGIVDQAGLHYALNFSLMSAGPVDYPSGTRVQVEGVLTPAEQLSTDMWQKYNMEGIIGVTSIRAL